METKRKVVNSLRALLRISRAQWCAAIMLIAYVILFELRKKKIMPSFTTKINLIDTHTRLTPMATINSSSIHKRLVQVTQIFVFRGKKREQYELNNSILTINEFILSIQYRALDDFVVAHTAYRLDKRTNVRQIE